MILSYQKLHWKVIIQNYIRQLYLLSFEKKQQREEKKKEISILDHLEVISIVTRIFQPISTMSDTHLHLAII